MITLYTQALTAKLLNTKNRGRILHLRNTYSTSGAEDAKLGVGSQVFLSEKRRQPFHDFWDQTRCDPA
jgi:uncharacterized membrane protein